MKENKQLRGCCKECVKLQDIIKPPFLGCKDKNCPCHSTKEKGENRCGDFHKKDGLPWTPCGNCGKPRLIFKESPTPTEEGKEGWGKRLKFILDKYMPNEGMITLVMREYEKTVQEAEERSFALAHKNIVADAKKIHTDFINELVKVCCIDCKKVVKLHYGEL